jgi:tetratricopeptide (TPR) repeat protein
MSRQETDKGIQDYLQAMEYTSRDEEPCYALGSAAFQQGRYNDALKYLNQALDLDPSFDAALLVRANTYLQLREYARAEADFLRYLDLNPHARSALEPLLSRCRSRQ